MLNVSPLIAIRQTASLVRLAWELNFDFDSTKSFPKKLRSSKKGSSDVCVIICFSMYQCIVFYWRLDNVFAVDVSLRKFNHKSWSDVCWGETIQAVSIGYDVTSCWNEAQLESFCFDWSQQRWRGRFFPKFDMMNHQKSDCMTSAGCIYLWRSCSSMRR